MSKSFSTIEQLSDALDSLNKELTNKVNNLTCQINQITKEKISKRSSLSDLFNVRIF
jgi:hypothetical protein